MESDDVRRVVANWPEYGGFITKERARERHPHHYPLKEILLKPERTVFDIDLLYQVGNVRLARTIMFQSHSTWSILLHECEHYCGVVCGYRGTCRFGLAVYTWI
jgi:hypothetical protein